MPCFARRRKFSASVRACLHGRGHQGDDDYALRLHTIYDALGMSDKAADVPRMLGKYKGREEALIAQVEQK